MRISLSTRHTLITNAEGLARVDGLATRDGKGDGTAVEVGKNDAGEAGQGFGEG
jgi:hypothetical protein